MPMFKKVFETFAVKILIVTRISKERSFINQKQAVR